jgi:hypothetical protein
MHPLLSPPESTGPAARHSVPSFLKGERIPTGQKKFLFSRERREAVSVIISRERGSCSGGAHALAYSRGGNFWTWDMPAIVPELKCALCSGPIDVLGDFFRASGAFLPPGDPLTDYCNAPLHWPCYTDWPHRERFAEQYVKAWAKATRLNPFWWIAYQDAHVLITVNPVQPVEEACVRLAAVGSDIRVALPQWPKWLARPESVTPSLHDVEKRELRKVIARLRERFPDDYAVVHAIDPNEKAPRREKRRTKNAPVEAKFQV